MVDYKKYLLALIFSCFFAILTGTTYYVSSAGNDASNGLSESTSWRTISKVNSFSFSPGDKIYFKRGETWTQTLIPSTSGTSSNRITFGAYGVGAKPLISGFTTISGWTNNGNGIYSKSVSTGFTPKMVTVNGKNQQIGRFPKTGYWIIDSHSGTTQLTANELNTGNWVGGNAVIRSALGKTETQAISDHSGTTITFSGTSYLDDEFGFFINNHISTLTTVGEWCYSGGTLYMFFGTANPANYTVKIAAIDNLINLSNKSYITIDGLALEGGNRGIFTSSSSYVTIQNCDIRLIGDHGIMFWGQGGGGGSYNTIDSNTITDCNNIGIETSWWREFSNPTITNNVLTNIGTIAGMGGNDWQGYTGIRSWSNNAVIQYNSVTNTGYHGISFYGTDSEVKNNFVNTFCSVKCDGAGIYTVRGPEGIVTGQKILNNIVINGVGVDPAYHPYDGWNAEGIYLDDDSYNTLVEGNTVWNCKGDGIFLHSGSYNIVRNNTSGNNGTTEGLYAQFKMARPMTNNPPANDNTITGNLLISLSVHNVEQSDATSYPAIHLAQNSSDLLNGILTSDFNCYALPLLSGVAINNSLRIYPDSYRTPTIWMTLPEWKAYSGQDANSTICPITINDINKLKFLYNETKSNKIVTLDGGYVDIAGKKYSGTITLLPYTSLVLLLDPNPAAAPSIPAYVSSAIENATPGILEMTYSLTLANMTPAASAFSVRVNSATRTVNAVSISGTKVRLTLASPILYGDVVTVAYSKPSSNPLQTAAGGQATNLSAQTATNRVNSTIIPVGPVYPVYVSSAVENETPTKIEIIYSIPLSNVLPAVSSFTVNINSVSRPVSSVAISGSSIILTLLTPVIFGDVVKVSYTKPGTNALQSSTGLQVATMGAQAVSNKVSSVGPIYVNSSVENSTPNILEINYNELLDSSTPTVSAFVVMVNGINSVITSVAVSGKKVLLTLTNPIKYGDIVTVSYTKPASNQLKKSTGESAGSFTSPQRVANNTVKKGNIYVYPNPASQYINIAIKEPYKDKQIVKIFDFSGKLCMETILDPFANTINIPINLNSGVYIVQVIINSLTSFTQKIIVTN